LDTYILFHIIGISLLLLCSFFFSGTETALFSLSNLTVKKLQREKGRRGMLVASLLANPRRLLISILIGNMFVNILSSTVADSLIRSIVPGGRGTFLAIVIMAFAILVIGEITPKTIAIQYAEHISLVVSPIINIIGSILFPIRRVVRAISDWLISFFISNLPPSDHLITEEEIKTAVGVGYREGVVDDQEKEMIHGVLGFADKKARDIMRPRQEIVSFEIGQPLSDIEAAIREKEYSRIPIYEGDFDNVIGILYAKDLLRQQSERAEFRKILRPVYFIPETKAALSLFRTLRQKKIHLAIVVDEYGGVSGIITLEDLLEEIIGEIRDKGDHTPLYQRLGPHAFRIEARMEIEEFNEILGTEIKDESNVTIGGFLISRIGSIPPVGYRYRFHNLHFTVSAAEKNRIEEIIVIEEAEK
jgi:putative hemolysin